LVEDKFGIVGRKSMWAEITIRTKNDLPIDLRAALNERLQLAGNLDQAYDSTSLRDTPEFRESVEFLFISDLPVRCSNIENPCGDYLNKNGSEHIAKNYK
jgi:hypothetical protein